MGTPADQSASRTTTLRERRSPQAIASGDGLAVMIQGSPAPVLRGHEDDGFDYSCATCGHVIVENTVIGELWDIAFRCSACGAFNATPSLPPGMPLAVPSVMVPPGKYMIGGTVDGKRGAVMVGQSALERRTRETGWLTPPRRTQPLDSPEALRGLIEQLKLLIGPALFEDLEISDRLARRAKKTPAKARHRLMELVEGRLDNALRISESQSVHVSGFRLR